MRTGGDYRDYIFIFIFIFTHPYCWKPAVAVLGQRKSYWNKSRTKTRHFQRHTPFDIMTLVSPLWADAQTDHQVRVLSWVWTPKNNSGYSLSLQGFFCFTSKTSFFALKPRRLMGNALGLIQSWDSSSIFRCGIYYTFRDTNLSSNCADTNTFFAKRKSAARWVLVSIW